MSHTQSVPVSRPAFSCQRLHELDALRATAMLIGIAYHTALSFSADFPWMVQDVAQAKWPFVFQAWVHGFRMQLFMLVSGFFTAMLWHRCRRVLITLRLLSYEYLVRYTWVGRLLNGPRNRPTPGTAP